MGRRGTLTPLLCAGAGLQPLSGDLGLLDLCFRKRAESELVRLQPDRRPRGDPGGSPPSRRKARTHWGAPGAGKSQVVAQVAAALDVRLIDIRAILVDLVDLRGLPTVEHGKAAWATPAFLPDEGAGILFLDELNAAPPLVQATCNQLVLDRALGEYRLPDGWTVFAAGNREGDRAVTPRMSSALANRFVHLSFEPDLDDWSRWAMGQADLRPEVVAFLR